MSSTRIATAALKAVNGTRNMPSRAGCRRTSCLVRLPSEPRFGCRLAWRRTPARYARRRRGRMSSILRIRLSLSTSMMKADGLNAIGVCELPRATFMYIRSCLGIERGDLSYQYSGLNHRGILHDFRHDGTDVTATVHSHAMVQEMTGLSEEALDGFGGVPTKYFRLFSMREPISPPGRARELEELRAQLLREIKNDAGGLARFPRQEVAAVVVVGGGAAPPCAERKGIVPTHPEPRRRGRDFERGLVRGVVRWRSMGGLIPAEKRRRQVPQRLRTARGGVPEGARYTRSRGRGAGRQIGSIASRPVYSA